MAPRPLPPLEGPVDRILVDKSERTLSLIEDGRVVRVYPVGLGFEPEGDGREGDGRTPEGVFRIDRLNPESRYHLSLGIDYPQRAGGAGGLRPWRGHLHPRPAFGDRALRGPRAAQGRLDGGVHRGRRRQRGGGLARGRDRHGGGDRALSRGLLPFLWSQISRGGAERAGAEPPPQRPGGIRAAGAGSARSKSRGARSVTGVWDLNS